MRLSEELHDFAGRLRGCTHSPSGCCENCARQVAKHLDVLARQFEGPLDVVPDKVIELSDRVVRLAENLRVAIENADDSDALTLSEELAEVLLDKCGQCERPASRCVCLLV